MRRIDKSSGNLLSKKYKTWVDKFESEGKQHPPTNRYYYDDVVMNLYKCQKGVCAYTEMFICVPELYGEASWIKNRYVISNEAEFKRTDHLGELDHFDPTLKKSQYWLWSNLFMIHAKINSNKSDKEVVGYLKPDLEEYRPEKYFDYDEATHRFIPNVEIEDEMQITEIQFMIDEVLCLNHGVIRNERRDFINQVKLKHKNGTGYFVDRFFTATGWCLSDIEG